MSDFKRSFLIGFAVDAVGTLVNLASFKYANRFLVFKKYEYRTTVTEYGFGLRMTYMRTSDPANTVMKILHFDFWNFAKTLIALTLAIYIISVILLSIRSQLSSTAGEI